jgi:hypothetical protein
VRSVGVYGVVLEIVTQYVVRRVGIFGVVLEIVTQCVVRRVGIYSDVLEIVTQCVVRSVGIYGVELFIVPHVIVSFTPTLFFILPNLCIHKHKIVLVIANMITYIPFYLIYTPTIVQVLSGVSARPVYLRSKSRYIM